MDTILAAVDSVFLLFLFCTPIHGAIYSVVRWGHIKYLTQHYFFLFSKCIVADHRLKHYRCFWNDSESHWRFVFLYVCLICCANISDFHNAWNVKSWSTNLYVLRMQVGLKQCINKSYFCCRNIKSHIESYFCKNIKSSIEWRNIWNLWLSKKDNLKKLLLILITKRWQIKKRCRK